MTPCQDLHYAMRRAGQNPTESEVYFFFGKCLLYSKGNAPQVQDMINKIDDGSASLNFGDFCLLMSEKTVEVDPETLFKDTFRVFSKDEEGKSCQPAATYHPSSSTTIYDKILLSFSCCMEF